tara:strand:- start:8495 stop:9157 length:663 start_codon:yes stop_codon:yes gene_type:complete
MTKFIVIGQGSQLIQLIRELFSLKITPDNLRIITVNGEFNLSCIEFLKYYKIDYFIVDKSTFISTLGHYIEGHKPDCVISLSNPFIIPKEILSLKPQFINFHPGILPFYKGSLSTVHSLINKESFVGGTWHYITPEVDQGNILKVFNIDIKDDNAFTLNHKIYSLGISYLEKVLEKVSNKDKGVPQDKLGKFYYNKFPDVSHLDSELQEKILFFPPKFIQ